MSARTLSGVRAFVYCNDNGNGYVDGVKMNDELIEHFTWTSIIPRTARLIAIETENTDGDWKIFAEFSTDFMTSNEWRCSTEFTEGWNTTDFNEPTEGWDYVSKGNSYIWVKMNTTGIVYCRGRLGKTI